MKYIDIHCHVNFPAYEEDRAEVIARAQAAGVGMILVGNDKKTSQEVVDLAAQHENMWAVIGLHPVHTAEESVSEVSGEAHGEAGFDYEFYKKLAQHPKVVGFGECGLDYFRVDPSTKKVQEQVFRAHIKLAHELQKPLVLHVRSSPTEDAYKDVLEILRDERAKNGYAPKGDVHFFAGGLDYARQFIELGFSLSFTGVITFAKEYYEVIKQIPADRIMSETDSPFVTPVPFRGQRNEPLHVVQVADTILQLRKDVSLEQLVLNARTLFKI